MTAEKITRRDIDEVKRQHILDNLLYTPKEVAAMLSVSVRTVFNLLDEGKLHRAKHGSRTTTITARSVEKYRLSITA
jgi:excisionase family DNA binding protein